MGSWTSKGYRSVAGARKVAAVRVTAVANRRTLDFDPIVEAGNNWSRNGWDAAVPGMAVITSIVRAHQILLARVHTSLMPFDLTFAQYEALMLLSFTKRGNMPLGKMGKRLQVHPASITNVIDRLEGKGLVQRLQHPDDMRTTLAVITRAGRKVAAKATAALNAEVFEHTGLDVQQELALVDIITGLRSSAGDFSA